MISTLLVWRLTNLAIEALLLHVRDEISLFIDVFAHAELAKDIFKEKLVPDK